jgi:hypothetical protein
MCAVVETFNPGTLMEMVSMNHDEKGTSASGHTISDLARLGTFYTIHLPCPCAGQRFDFLDFLGTLVGRHRIVFGEEGAGEEGNGEKDRRFHGLISK